MIYIQSNSHKLIICSNKYIILKMFSIRKMYVNYILAYIHFIILFFNLKNYIVIKHNKIKVLQKIIYFSVLVTALTIQVLLNL